jgi:glycosyltransferase involved in cell wall biosynthesis
VAVTRPLPCPSTEVLLCTYNGARFIAEQLHSILRQTQRVTKISIYDDHSTDDTVARIHDVVTHLPPRDRSLFHLHVNAGNIGYASNFVQAIQRASEEILFLCDQDDIWEPDKVAHLVELFDRWPSDLVFSDGSLVDEEGRAIGQRSVLESHGLDPRHGELDRFRAHAFELLMKQNYVNGAAAAVRRRAAQGALPMPCDMPHDYWLAIWCSLHGGVTATAHVLYRYRQHRGNVIGIGSRNPLYAWLGVWRHPQAPRERELRIWQAVTARLETLPASRQLDLARAKLDWLGRVVSRGRPLARGVEILRSAWTGSYRRYSPPDAFLRDVVSLLK